MRRDRLEEGQHGAGGRRQDAGREMVSRCAPELRREPAAARRPGRRLRVLGRARLPAARQLLAAHQRGVARGAGARAARPARRATASPRSSPTCPRPACSRSPRCRRASSGRRCSPDFGIERRARPLRPDRAEGPVRRRRLPLRAGASSTCSSAWREIAEGLPTLRKVVVVPHLNPRPDVSDIPKAVLLEEWLRKHTPGEIAVRADAVRAPGLHPVQFRHHRHAQVHRARRGRRAAAER